MREKECQWFGKDNWLKFIKILCLLEILFKLMKEWKSQLMGSCFRPTKLRLTKVPWQAKLIPSTKISLKPVLKRNRNFKKMGKKILLINMSSRPRSSWAAPESSAAKENSSSLSLETVPVSVKSERYWRRRKLARHRCRWSCRRSLRISVNSVCFLRLQ